ncbi:MAG: hypothetical protein J6334_09140 [Kiritimatiellae bacterium]|nr:hypothetical protein [Kiritimatiellia bacterium]
MKSAVALGVMARGGNVWAEMAKHPLAGTVLPKWEKGVFRITTLYTGSSEASFLVFPDGTSALIDCGDYRGCGVPCMPNSGRRAGEWTARWIVADNPNGKKVDYFVLTHYHSDHFGCLRFHAGDAPGGTYKLSGLGQAMEFLTFDTMIDRSWPDVQDPAPRPDDFDDGTIGQLRGVYNEAIRRGAKVERFRLEKGSNQIALRHGGWKGFSFAPLCANGCVLRRDGTVLDLGTVTQSARTTFNENALSLAMVFSQGDFRYYNGGDFSSNMKTPDGKRVEIEDVLAPECPQVDVAKANHHGHHSMPDALVKALHARVIVTGVWHDEHMNRPTMRRLAKADWPCLYAPGFFPEKRRQADVEEPWLKAFAAESFTGAHAVIDVAPDGGSYRLMMVSAADESRRILGAYDFKTSAKTA